jgi:hypothetical protein
MVFIVTPQMLGESIDTVRQNRDLNFRRSAVGFVPSVFADQPRLVFLRN